MVPGADEDGDMIEVIGSDAVEAVAATEEVKMLLLEELGDNVEVVEMTVTTLGTELELSLDLSVSVVVLA